MTSQLTGRQVFFALCAFFFVVFAVNGALAWYAITTHSGNVANEPYRSGLKYNQRIAADEAQVRLGWSEQVSIEDRSLTVRMADREGHPVTGLRIAGHLGRPASAEEESALSLAENEPGIYRAPVAVTEGNYIADIEARYPAGDDIAYRGRARLWLKP